MQVEVEEQLVHPVTHLTQTPEEMVHPVVQAVQLLFPESVQLVHLGSSHKTQVVGLAVVKR